ncbi:hypothetical protein ABZ192_36795 [Streptomyces sp. NPDC006235]|uniref:hypothetical protein n=1 Tax=Streptomyces sp. NPDC006235 TaxID=3156736 RepID=UPI0033BF4820
MYGPAAHRATVPHKQLLLFAQEKPPTLARPAGDLTALRTDREALELTTAQIRRPGAVFATAGEEARRRVRKLAHPNPEPAHQDPGGARRTHTNQTSRGRTARTSPAQAPHRPGPRRARMMRAGVFSAH